MLKIATDSTKLADHAEKEGVGYIASGVDRVFNSAPKRLTLCLYLYAIRYIGRCTSWSSNPEGN
jgi:hypothetical protein